VQRRRASSGQSTRVGAKVWGSGLRAIPAIVIVGTLTFICFAFHFSFPIVSFGYLIVVVLQSLTGDFLSSIFVSAVSFLCLNYFFVPPIFSFRISDSSDTLALFSFLMTGVVITRLTSRLQKTAELERLHREEVTKLYGLARQLLALEPGLEAEAELLKSLKSEFSLRAVCLFDASTADLLMEGSTAEQLAEKTRAAYIARREFQDSSSEVSIQLLYSGNQVTGAIGFERLRDFETRAAPLAAMAAMMTERTRIFRQSAHAAAATEAEVFRGAVLDALAHEFKTPLATIAAAAGGLAGAGSLQPQQLELARAVETESTRLAHLTSRLLRLAQLDREEVKPNCELTNLSQIVRSVCAQHSTRWPDRRIVVSHAHDVSVQGDRELLWLALAQLLDNACKYSSPTSEINVSLQAMERGVMVRVWNGGSPIPLSERKRIFDRFFRGSNAMGVSPGTGLGLYIARKIALAHGGTLELDDDNEANGGAGFRLAMPMATNDCGDDHAEVQCARRG
jgi:two-component system sensor histidine kinase KdpD